MAVDRGRIASPACGIAARTTLDNGTGLLYESAARFRRCGLALDRKVEEIVRVAVAGGTDPRLTPTGVMCLG
jgi:hypothetical protein